MRRAVMALTGLALLVASCSVTSDPGPVATGTATAQTVLVRFEDATVTAEVVADDDGRHLGLMHRTALGADAGMLFLFPRLDAGGFWMKNTRIPLQIAYMRRRAEESFEVVAVLDMVPCTKDPCTVYDPGMPYDAALEVNAGWFDRHEVRAASLAETEGSLPEPR